jgi:hypothetical protein
MSQRLSNTASGLSCMALKAWKALVNASRTLLAVETESYRPELYYMRGPGPRWREKHTRWRDPAAR